MKRALMLLITLSLIIFGAEFPVHAHANVVSEDLVQVLDVYEDTSQYDALNAQLEARGRELINSQNPNARVIVKLLNVTRLVQSDSRWSSVQLGTSNNTIGSAGCCLTSFTMIRNFLSGTSDTPVDVNTALGSSACPFVYSVAASHYGYTIATARHEDAGISDDSAISLIIGAMDTYDVPILVGVKNESGGTHFVAAVGYNSANGILIKDPAGRNYQLLSEYLDTGYTVHRIYCFIN